MEKMKWEQDGKNYQLKNEGSVLLELLLKSGGVTTFTIGKKEYHIKRKGFWGSMYVLQHKEEEILQLSFNFWTSKGKIVCKDGLVYNCTFKCKKDFTLRFSENDNEILSFTKSLQNNKPHLSFLIGISLIDAEQLLLLSALGLVIIQTIFPDEANGDDVTFITMVAAIS